MIEQLAEQLCSLAFVLRSAATASLVPFPWSTRSVKDPDQLDVVFHEMEYAPHDSLLNGIRRWLLGPDELHLLRYEIVESPSRFVNGHTKRPAIFVEVIRGIFSKRNKFTFADHISQAIDAHDGLPTSDTYF